MKQTALFKSGTEPSETSSRFSKLENPEKGSFKINNKTITLTWDNVATPSSLNSKEARAEFANYFKDYKKRYSHSYQLFENEYMKIYDNYNTSNIGTFGYHVYLKDKNGNLVSLGWTSNNSYTYTASTGGNFEFVIKSSYSIFKSNQSSGLTIKASIEKDPEPEEKMTAIANTICVEKDGTVNPKIAVKVTLNQKDITNLVTIIASAIDTSTTGEKNITYTISYNDETIKVNGKVNVSDSCKEE